VFRPTEAITIASIRIQGVAPRSSTPARRLRSISASSALSSSRLKRWAMAWRRDGDGGRDSGAFMGKILAGNLHFHKYFLRRQAARPPPARASPSPSAFTARSFPLLFAGREFLDPLRRA